MDARLEAPWSKLSAIVGEEYLRLAAPTETIDGASPQMVIEPGSADELVQALHFAQTVGLQVAPRGGGTKLEWGNRPRRVDVVLSMRRLNRIVEHAWGDMTATVEAGCPVEQFQQVLAEHGQRLALDPLWPAQTTIGGILATNESGTLRVRFGGLRDLLIGITIALPNGTLAKSGGKVVKNVAGYDLPKLMIGSLGTLGVITEATFRLYPVSFEERSFSFTAPTTHELNHLLLAIQDSTLSPTGLQVSAQNDVPPRLDVRFESMMAALDAQEHQLTKLAVAAQRVDHSSNLWNSREQIWHGAEPGVVSKLSMLPTQISEVCESVRSMAATRQLDWKVVVQAVGLGLLRLEGREEQALINTVENLRAELEAQGGALVILHCPSSFKAHIDVWGTPSDALPLMRRIKEQFDPAGILNPGRFVGGI